MPFPPSLRRTGAVIVVTLIASVVAPLAAPAAGASPIDDKKAQAAQLAAAIDANGAKISAVDEQMNGAQLKLQDAQSQIETARQAIDVAQAQAAGLKATLGRRAAAVYTDQAGSGSTSSAGNLQDPITAAARSAYAAAAAKKNDGTISKLTVVKEQLAEKKATYEAAKVSALAQTAQLATSKQQLTALNATQEQLLTKTQGELADLVKQDQIRRDNEAKAAALRAIQAAQADAARQRALAAQQSTRNVSGSHTTSAGRSVSNAADTVLPTNLPAPSPRAAQAIAFAQQQLGKPYVYAATGPDSYDCSGLTMRAWQAAGVSMPHYSGAQYAMFPKVPLDQLQPGDLVFRGAGGSDHVMLYIGGGQVIAAPHTGDHVKVQGMGSVIQYGVRPG
ncbi:MAG: cell wall-associated hydrolase, invasion-associated protein [Actinomycetia bacterium]|nr:cell wall-associated hydrolase, invasion-associated protein [Actinomycetes bacterium]